ncbi:MAG: amidohydrolase [Ardenticatenaceae bacterium]|nr:amidohydrolase [Ardenticatenaceae bacterium]
MPRVLIKNADVVTLNPAGDVLQGADIAIEGRTIAAIGAVPAGFIPDETLDATGHVALPGFWNAHTHAAMTFERGYADDLPLDRWFNERIWVAESALTSDDVYWGAALAAAEMIRGGTVGFADHYFYMDRVAEVIQQSGLKALLAWCVFGLASEVGTDLEGSLEFTHHFNGAADGRIKTILGPHAPYTCPPEFLTTVAEAARREGFGIHIHLAESEEQVMTSLKKYGRTLVAHVDHLGLFDVPGPILCAHCIYVNELDRQILTIRGANVVQCPNCHMKLAMGVTPVLDLLARGVNVALGTDGAGSNNNLDMLEEAQLAGLIQKQHLGDAQVLPGDSVLRLATRHGALATGFKESGVLAPGMAADLLLFDFDQPHLRPRHSVVSNLVHAARSSDIRHVIIDGRTVMKDRELLTLDEERILWEAERRAFGMIGRATGVVREYRS